ncbi:MAG: MBL fold metallo-hydrolase [bacterium]|nr:MBL fold metallo-hydrolase [bacterium]
MKISILASGSRGNASVIKSDKQCVLVDAGLGIRDLQNRLKIIDVDPREVDSIFVTHEHGDHIKGLGKFSKYYKTPVFITPGSYVKLHGSIKRDLDSHVNLFDPGECINGNGLTVKSFQVSHDSAESVGFTFSENGNKIGYVTDIGQSTPSVIEELKNCNVLVIESNHDSVMLKNGSYHYVLKQRIAGPEGHISNEAASNLIKEIFSDKLKAVFLAHLSRENNKPELALSTISDNLKTISGFDKLKTELLLTYQDKPTSWYEI